ncbi:hypothetical protein BDN70DRAFT_804789, partial [Pholiota conissans]
MLVHQQPLNRLRILQINLNKSNKGHLDLINKPLSKDWDIILIQEPHITKMGLIRTPKKYTIVYPPDRYKDGADPVRSVIMVNTQLTSSSWRAINIRGNNDITAIQISNGQKQLTIFNIY